jgi:amidase
VSELCFLSATEMARRIREGELSSDELVRAHLQRIEAINPELNAVVQLDAARALEAAAKADASLAGGEASGPLHGVPVTIKDCFDTAGIVTTGGTPGCAQRVPEQDAEAVSRLKAAGAVVLGKTNCPEYCLAFETDNLIYGRTNNPYASDHVPGGSSGGESAAVAAGLSPLGLGSDAGGSIRVPAHCCGLAGLKPTTGRVPTTGYFIGLTALLDRTNSIGPLARSVDDLTLALGVLAGPHASDVQTQPVPLGDPADVHVGGLRIAVYTDNGVVTPSAETIGAVTAAAAALKESGAALTERLPPGLNDVVDLFLELYATDGGQWLRDRIAALGTKESHPMMQGLLAQLAAGPAMSGADVTRAIERWYAFRTQMALFMADYDLILSPASAYPALAHGETFNHMPSFSYTTAGNLLGWPGVVVRGGTSGEGLPIGVQITARPWCEHVALAAAGTIETALGGYRRP